MSLALLTSECMKLKRKRNTRNIFGATTTKEKKKRKEIKEENNNTKHVNIDDIF